jgi:hypothetical protein
MKTANDVLQRFHSREIGDIETLAFNTIMAQGGNIGVKDGGALFEFYDGSRIYTNPDVIGLCYDTPDDMPKPIKWTQKLSIFDWKNYETWNVALWISNDHGLYELAKDCHKDIGDDGMSPYVAFTEWLRECSGGSEVGFQTPDGVAWNDSGLDIDALDEMISEL